MTKKVILLPNIRSGWNVGAFFRTADAFKFDHIYISGYTAQPPHKAISKTALGADEFVPWTYFQTAEDAIIFLRSEGFSFVGLEITEKAIPLSKISFPKKTCLVMGNEVEGISSEILSQMDFITYIPMLGKKESLNVSIAGSIAMWEITKQH